MQRDGETAEGTSRPSGSRTLRRITALAALAALLLGALGSAAAAPVIQELPYRFKVPGAFRAGRSYDLVFRLFDSPDMVAVTTPLWEETRRYKIPASHLITHRLGSVVPFSNDGTALPPVDFSIQLWVEVRSGSKLIGGKRTQLAPIVPYALYTLYSEAVPAGSVTSAGILDGTVTNVDIAAGAAISDSKLATITSAGKVADSALPANIVRTNTTQTITGKKTFQTGTGTPFNVAAGDGGMVANLYAERAGSAGSAGSADTLGGNTVSDLDVRYGAVPPSPSGSISGYTTSTLDSTGNVGTFSSITLGADGFPVISYYDETNFALKVLHCGNAACSAGNTDITVDPSNAGWYSSITIGADGLPLVSYLDRGTSKLNVLHCGNAACSAGNTIVTPDAVGQNGDYNSITIGADGLPVVSYLDSTNFDLKVLHCGNAACSAGNTVSTADSVGSVGFDTSITIGADGMPIVSYRDITNSDLKVLHCGNAACSAGNTVSTADSVGLVGSYTSITIGADGLPIVSYMDSTNSDLKVLHCGNVACSSGNAATTVDSVGIVGYYTSITIGNDGLAIVAYSDNTNSDLKVLHCGNAACSSGNVLTTVDSVGSVGYYPSITIGADGLPVVSYRDQVNGDLKIAKGFSRQLGRR